MPSNPTIDINKFIPSLIHLVGYLFLFIAIVLILTRVDTYLKYTGINDCARISRFETTDDSKSAKYSYPMQDIYNACLEKKGL